MHRAVTAGHGRGCVRQSRDSGAACGTGPLSCVTTLVRAIHECRARVQMIWGALHRSCTHHGHHHTPPAEHEVRAPALFAFSTRGRAEMTRVRPPLTPGKAPHHDEPGDSRPPSRGVGREYLLHAGKLSVCYHARGEAPGPVSEWRVTWICQVVIQGCGSLSPSVAGMA